MAALPNRLPVQDLAAGVRILLRVPAALRRPVGSAEAHETLSRRFRQRESDFLALVGGAVYANRGSPYRELLRIAGCEYGDLARLVRGSGVEGALTELYRAGVYLTVDELKGRRPTTRGSQTVAVDPRRLSNSRVGADLLFQTSGSRGAATNMV